MNKETKFTRGDWDVFDIHPDGACFAIAPKQGARVYGGTKVVFDDVCTVYNSMPNSKANAHLIKTAPKLYAKLDELSALMVMLDEQTHANIELDAVKYDIDKLLAEARGKTC